MNMQEVVLLLETLRVLQPQASDQVAAEVWHATLDDDVDAKWALHWVTKHHGQPNAAKVVPGTVNAAWRAHTEANRLRLQLQEDQRAAERRCAILDCRCTHTDPCFKGWIDTPDGSTTSPCPVCRGSLVERLDTVPPPGSRTAADFARLREREAS